MVEFNQSVVEGVTTPKNRLKFRVALSVIRSQYSGRRYAFLGEESRFLRSLRIDLVLDMRQGH